MRVFLPTRQTRRGHIQKDWLRKETIDVFKSWLARGDIGKRKELMVLGSYLYKTLFDDRISQLFKNEFDKVQAEEVPTVLRLVLEFEPKADSLTEWPWEYLAYPSSDLERGFFIAARLRLILTRHVPQKEEIVRGLKPEKKPLSILVVVSKPKGYEVNEKPVLDAIEELKTQFKDKELIKYKICENPTKNSLQKIVPKEKPHVVHFIGHGKYTENSGSLALVDENNDPQWISDVDLVDSLMDHPPRLIFLHTSVQKEDDKAQNSYNAFYKMAHQLVKSRVPAVVAMQYPIPDQVAGSFVKQFYRSLGEGKPVDMAVQEGRLELGQYLQQDNFSSRAFGSPVVYLQSQDGIILAEEPPIIPPLPGPGIVNCPYSLHADHSCTGRVNTERVRKGVAKQCITCGRALMICPKCGSVMGKLIGRCDCGYSTKISIEDKVPVREEDKVEKPERKPQPSLPQQPRIPSTGI